MFKSSKAFSALASSYMQKGKQVALIAEDLDSLKLLADKIGCSCSPEKIQKVVVISAMPFEEEK